MNTNNFSIQSSCLEFLQEIIALEALRMDSSHLNLAKYAS